MCDTDAVPSIALYLGGGALAVGLAFWYLYHNFAEIGRGHRAAALAAGDGYSALRTIAYFSMFLGTLFPIVVFFPFGQAWRHRRLDVTLSIHVVPTDSSMRRRSARATEPS